jgi:hypothetical protein
MIGAFALQLFNLLFPVILGLCVAFVLHPLVDAVERPLKKLSKLQKGGLNSLCRAASIVISLAIVVGVVTLLVFIVLPEVTATIRGFVNNIPYYIGQVRSWAEKLPAVWAFIESLNIDFTQLQINWQQIALTVTDFLKNSAGNMLSGVLGATATLFGVVVDVLFGFIIALYVLAQKEQIGRFCTRFVKAFLPEKPGNYLFHVVRVADEAFTNFVSDVDIHFLHNSVLLHSYSHAFHEQVYRLHDLYRCIRKTVSCSLNDRVFELTREYLFCVYSFWTYRHPPIFNEYSIAVVVREVKGEVDDLESIYSIRLIWVCFLYIEDIHNPFYID